MRRSRSGRDIVEEEPDERAFFDRQLLLRVKGMLFRNEVRPLYVPPGRGRICRPKAMRLQVPWFEVEFLGVTGPYTAFMTVHEGITAEEYLHKRLMDLNDRCFIEFFKQYCPTGAKTFRIQTGEDHCFRIQINSKRAPDPDKEPVFQLDLAALDESDGRHYTLHASNYLYELLLGSPKRPNLHFVEDVVVQVSAECILQHKPPRGCLTRTIGWNFDSDRATRKNRLRCVPWDEWHKEQEKKKKPSPAEEELQKEEKKKSVPKEKKQQRKRKEPSPQEEEELQKEDKKESVPKEKKQKRKEKEPSPKEEEELQKEDKKESLPKEKKQKKKKKKKKKSSPQEEEKQEKQPVEPMTESPTSVAKDKGSTKVVQIVSPSGATDEEADSLIPSSSDVDDALQLEGIDMEDELGSMTGDAPVTSGPTVTPRSPSTNSKTAALTTERPTRGTPARGRPIPTPGSPWATSGIATTMGSPINGGPTMGTHTVTPGSSQIWAEMPRNKVPIETHGGEARCEAPPYLKRYRMHRSPPKAQSPPKAKGRANWMATWHSPSIESNPLPKEQRVRGEDESAHSFSGKRRRIDGSPMDAAKVAEALRQFEE